MYSDIPMLLVGNDAIIHWDIYKSGSGEKEDFTMSEVFFFVCNAQGKHKVPYEITDNRITARIPGIVLQSLGIHHIELVWSRNNKKNWGKITKKNAFVVSSEVEEEEIVTELQVSDSYSVGIGNDGLSAYDIAIMSGYQGTMEEFSTLLGDITKHVSLFAQLTNLLKVYRYDSNGDVDAEPYLNPNIIDRSGNIRIEVDDLENLLLRNKAHEVLTIGKDSVKLAMDGGGKDAGKIILRTKESIENGNDAYSHEVKITASEDWHLDLGYGLSNKRVSLGRGYCCFHIYDESGEGDYVIQMNCDSNNVNISKHKGFQVEVGGYERFGAKPEGDTTIKNNAGKNVMLADPRRMILYHPNGKQFIHSNPEKVGKNGEEADDRFTMRYPNGVLLFRADDNPEDNEKALLATKGDLEKVFLWNSETPLIKETTDDNGDRCYVIQDKNGERIIIIANYEKSFGYNGTKIDVDSGLRIEINGEEAQEGQALFCDGESNFIFKEIYTKEQADEIFDFILTKMYRFAGAPVKDAAVINYIGSDDGNEGMFLLGAGFFDKFANLSEDWGKSSAIEIFRGERKEIINVYAPSGHSLVYGRKETLEDRNVYYDLIGANTTDESIIVCLTIEDKEGNELLLKRGINANTKIIEGIEEFIQGGMADPSLLEEKTICTKEYVDEQIGAIDEVLNYIIGAE